MDRKTKLATPDGFAEVFMQEVNQQESNRETFDRLNYERERYYGKPKYSCYESFLTVLSRKRQGR